MKFSALILAAGFSSRMGRFKPLLPLGTTPVLQRVISTFQSAGVDDIRVVTGHRAGEIESVATAMGVKTVFNSDYDRGMFSSVTAGVRSLAPDSSAFFVMPVDIPLVVPDTVKALIALWQEKQPAVVYPVFKGHRGHPPLVSMATRDHILNWPGRQGLRGALEELENLAVEIKTDDRYILMDMDRPVDYERILHQALGLDRPAR